MKELLIEEKARRYDEAIEIAKKINNEHKAQPFDVMLKVFPELAESEDEKIRKAIKKALQVRCDGSRIISDEPVTLEEAIAWLEKQGEQKSDDIRTTGYWNVQEVEQKPAWSEEDEVKINRIVACLENLNVADNDILLKDVDWLKSLKDRYTWKPSDEQMERLKGTINSLPHQEVLYSLYQDLKKLREE